MIVSYTVTGSDGCRYESVHEEVESRDRLHLLINAFADRPAVPVQTASGYNIVYNPRLVEFTVHDEEA